MHSVILPAGPHAAAIARHGWMLFAVCAVVWALVTIALLWAIARRRAVEGERWQPASTGRATAWVFAASIATAGTLIVLLDRAIATGKVLAEDPRTQALHIEVVGHRWWWEVRYLDGGPARNLTTANEIHVPTHTPVAIALRSDDVIHSFWVPSLDGKKDLIPGRTNAMWLEVDTPGVYRGQCAEFCGYQHAHMAFEIVAQPPEAFAAWLDAQLEPAADATEAEAARGEQLFLSRQCASCHQIRGTTAAATVAPDLTHVASRRTLAAGTLPHTAAALAGWVADPQSIKPGAAMPVVALAPDELGAIVAYLETLR